MEHKTSSTEVNQPPHEKESEPAMKKTSLSHIVKILGLLCLCIAPLAQADAKLEDLSIMATGPLDSRAVVKSGDGKMHVLKVGDTLPGTQATLIQVLADKLVVEESVGKEGQPKVKQTAWLLKAAKAGVPGTVQRFDSEGPAPVQHAVTVMKPLSVVQEKAKVKAKDKVKTKTEVKVGAKSKAEDKSKTEAKSKAEAKTKTKAKPEVKTKPQANARPETTTKK